VWKKLPHGDVYKTPPKGTCDFPPDFTTIDTEAPERRASFVIGTRVDGRAFVVYGGRSDCGLLADAWWWSGGNEAWTNVVKSPVGLSCLRYSTTCGGLCG
jgi:hypothetical protein